MTVSQFLDYLASFGHTRQLAFALAEVLDDRNRVTAMRRTA
jgi:hypothetical protein